MAKKRNSPELHLPYSQFAALIAVLHGQNRRRSSAGVGGREASQIEVKPTPAATGPRAGVGISDEARASLGIEGEEILRQMKELWHVKGSNQSVQSRKQIVLKLVNMKYLATDDPPYVRFAQSQYHLTEAGMEYLDQLRDTASQMVGAINGLLRTLDEERR